MTFAHSFALLAALVLPWFWWVATRGRPHPGHGRAVWRASTAAFLVLAASGVAISSGEAPVTLVVAIDRSASIPLRAQQRALSRVSDLASTLRVGDRLGLVSFGADAALEFRPVEGGRLAAFHTTVADTGTDIGAALRLARAVLPTDGPRRIVLMSDGRDTAGGAEREALNAAAAGIPIDVVLPPVLDLAVPLRVTRVVAPAEASVLEPYLVSIEVAGAASASGSVVVYRDGQVIGTPQITVGADGTGSFTLSERQDESGAYIYGATTQFVDVGEAAQAGAVVVVEGMPRVLYVSSRLLSLSPALAGAGFSITHIVPEQVPTTAGGLAPFAGVVLDDVPAERLTSASAEALVEYVENAGGGLLMLGSSRTLALGGYPTTPLERIIPVDLRPRAGQRVPPVDLVLVFDKSGSMADVTDGVPKIEVARQAVMRAVEVMPSNDAIGVLAFDSKPEIIKPLAVARDALALHTALQKVLPGGSTSIAPALETAFQWLRAPGRPAAARRHILLISDGRTSNVDAATLRALARSRGAEISVVAIGPNADRALLDELAASSGGRAYFPQNLRDLPRVVAREAVRSSGGGIVQERFVPHGAVHPVMAGLDRARLPSLNGYVVGAAKPTATAILASHLDDPILCAWRAGLGRVAVFTADLASPWSASLRSWPEGDRLWAQTVRWLSRRQTERAVRLQIRDAEGGPRLAADLDAPDGSFLAVDAVTAIVRQPGGSVVEIALEPVEPGRYEAPIPVAGSGPHLVDLTARERTGVEHRVVRALYWSADREGQTRGTDVQSLSRLASLTGGRVLRADESPFELPRPSGYRDVSMWAAAVALVMFLLDVAAGNGIGAERLRRWRRTPGKTGQNRVAA